MFAFIGISSLYAYPEQNNDIQILAYWCRLVILVLSGVLSRFIPLIKFNEKTSSRIESTAFALFFFAVLIAGMIIILSFTDTHKMEY